MWQWIWNKKTGRSWKSLEEIVMALMEAVSETLRESEENIARNEVKVVLFF